MIKVYSRRQLMAFKPYDAEIAFLESMGTQYIDTGITLTNGLTLECSACITGRHTNTQILFGSSDGAAYYFAALNKKWYFWSSAYSAGDSTAKTSIRVVYHADYNIDVYLDAVKKDTFQRRLTAHNLYLFAIGDGGYASNARIYSFSVYDINNTLVRDFIPVRVGNAGYMYDKVSGKLFGNAGTGNFILGPDK